MPDVPGAVGGCRRPRGARASLAGSLPPERETACLRAVAGRPPLPGVDANLAVEPVPLVRRKRDSGVAATGPVLAAAVSKERFGGLPAGFLPVLRPGDPRRVFPGPTPARFAHAFSARNAFAPRAGAG